MKKLQQVACLTTLLACSSGAVLAQSTMSDANSTLNYNRSMYIAPTLNVIDPDDKFGSDHRGPGAGIRFGVPLSPSWDVQLGLTGAGINDGGMRYRQAQLSADALYFFSRSRLRPFVLAGLGWQYDRLKNDNTNAQDYSPFAAIGVGVQYAITPQWGAQVDFRRTHAFMEKTPQFGMQRANTNLLSVGMTYAFSAPAEPVRPTRVVQSAPAPVVIPPAPAPAPAAAPAPAPRFERYTLSATEVFAFGSDKLNPQQPKLDEIAQVLNQNADITNVDINGYTDRIGSESYNAKLSQRRADAVKQYLASKGVAANRLNAVGKGESDPIVECREKSRAALIKCLEPNRRVEVEEIVIERRVQ